MASFLPPFPCSLFIIVYLSIYHYLAFIIIDYLLSLYVYHLLIIIHLFIYYYFSSIIIYLAAIIISLLTFYYLLSIYLSIIPYSSIYLPGLELMQPVR